MSIGFIAQQSTNCVHVGAYYTGILGDYALRHCENCGASWLLVKLDTGQLAWEPVEEVTHVVGVGQAVLAVQTDEGDERVQPQPKPRRRSRRAVQSLPTPVESHPAADRGEEEAL